MLIRFWVNAVDRMPDPHVLTLIAHELMHACLWAMGQRDNALDENFVQNCVVSDWNFDEFALQEWIDANADSLRSSLATCSTRIDEELS